MWAGIADYVLAVNSAILRPFRQRVDLELVILLFVLVLVIGGGWHIVLETVEMDSGEDE